MLETANKVQRPTPAFGATITTPSKSPVAVQATPASPPPSEPPSVGVEQPRGEFEQPFYEQPFEEFIEYAVGVVMEAAQGEWDTVRRLNETVDSAFIKNAGRVMVYANDACKRFFTPQKPVVGQTVDRFLDRGMLDISQRSDEVIFGGAGSLDMRHTARFPDGGLYNVRTIKVSLATLRNPGLAILGASRVEGLVRENQIETRYRLVESFEIFRGLSETDRELARLISTGATGREIAKQLDMTSRTVELRKKKILDALRLEQTVDLIKLLVRLEERGFVDLAL